MQACPHPTRRFLFGLGFAISLAPVALGACTRDRPHTTTADQPPVASNPGDQPPSAPPAAAPPSSSAPSSAAAPSGDSKIAGTVVETMDAAGYTYAKIDRGTGQVWVAGPETKLAVGTVIGEVAGTAMPGFHSDTLNRTFDEIYFINSYPVSGSAPPNPHGAPPPPTKLTEKVAPASGGQTIAQVFSGKDTLEGKPVVVRGKVVKLNNGILGRNWIHLQDGTGAAGTNDLMVTSTATASLGDVVVVRGTLAKNKDFGAGYKYDVIVENATIATN